MVCGCCATNAWTIPAEIPALVKEHESKGRYIKLKDGSSIFVRTEGPASRTPGQPTIVMIHGVPASSFLYRKFFPRLGELGYHAVAVDLPGLGLSDKPPDRDYSWPALAETLHEILEHPDLRSTTAVPLHLVLHDIGGPIGALYAVGHPDRVVSTTVLDTLLDMEHFRPPFPMYFFPLPLIGGIAVRTFTPWVFRQFMHLRGVADPQACDHEESVAWVWLLKQNHGGRTFAKIMKSFPAGREEKAALTERIRTRWNDSGMPMQVVWAEGEVAIPQSQCQYIETNFKHVRGVHRVPGGHFFQLESADIIVEKIHQFLQDEQQQLSEDPKEKPFAETQQFP